MSIFEQRNPEGLWDRFKRNFISQRYAEEFRQLCDGGVLLLVVHKLWGWNGLAVFIATALVFGLLFALARTIQERKSGGAPEEGAGDLNVRSVLALMDKIPSSIVRRNGEDVRVLDRIPPGFPWVTAVELGLLRPFGDGYALAGAALSMERYGRAR